MPHVQAPPSLPARSSVPCRGWVARKAANVRGHKANCLALEKFIPRASVTVFVVELRVVGV